MENGWRGYAEYAVYGGCLLAFGISSFFLGFNLLLIALALVSLGIGAFKRSNILSFAALLSYAAAVGTAETGFTFLNALAFSIFSLLPFFACFRMSGSKLRGVVPWEAAAVLIPAFIACLLLVFSMGGAAVLSSEQVLMPEWLLLFSLVALLLALLSIPLVAEAANLFKSPAG